MRLDEITCSMVRRAIGIYTEAAYRGAAGRAPATVSLPEDPERRVVDFLDVFLDESKDHVCGRRYSLRLGSADYPYMKLCLEESPFEGEFAFSVDTHDQMFTAPDPSEQERLARMIQRNRALKSEIEAGWEGAGLPTHRTVCHDVEARLARLGAGLPRGKGRRLLVVEDQEVLRETIAKVLEWADWKVDRAADGREALHLAHPGRHALVLMDVEMPRLTGLEALARLRADPLRRDLPVLLMTAANSVRLEDQAPHTGFLLKPFSAEALLRFVGALAGR